MSQFALFEVEKSKNLIFHRIIPFFAINKLRLTRQKPHGFCRKRSNLVKTIDFRHRRKSENTTRIATSTPSGNPKLKFWLSLLIPKLFFYPLGKAKAVKKSIDFFTAPLNGKSIIMLIRDAGDTLQG